MGEGISLPIATDEAGKMQSGAGWLVPAAFSSSVTLISALSSRMRRQGLKGRLFKREQEKSLNRRGQLYFKLVLFSGTWVAVG